MTVPNAFRGLVGEKPRLMHIRVECPDCHRLHRVAEARQRGSRFWMICHTCECPFWVQCPA